MEFLIPLMPLFGALPIAVAAVVIARMWSRRRDVPLADLEAQNHELRAELDRTRERGYAVNDEEPEAGVRAIGVPIINSRGRPAAGRAGTSPR